MLKTSAFEKDITKNVKRYTTDWEKTFVNLIKYLYPEYVKNCNNSLIRRQCKYFRSNQWQGMSVKFQCWFVPLFNIRK